MNKLIKVKGYSFIGRGGKLILRKQSRRLIGSKITLTKAKERVKVLRKALDKLKTLTAADPQKLEYGAVINKATKRGKGVVNKGYFYTNATGQKVPTVDLPKGSDKFNWLLHSHPDAIPLSVADITYPKKGGTIFAIDKDGSIYRATRKAASTTDITDTYQAARRKIRETGLIQDAFVVDQFRNPSVSQEAIKEDLHGVVQHKLLTHLHNKGLIHYRAKLSPAMKRKVARYAEIMRVELKQHRRLVTFRS